MKLGVVMLVHTALDRAEQAIRHWVAAGCPVVVHVDQKVADADVAAFQSNVADLPLVSFSKRHRCDWGTWSLVAATQDAVNQLMNTYPQLRHFYLSSGACLPLRPIQDLQAFLDGRPDTDFIESTTTAEIPWTVGGLDRERFTLRFPFSWRRNRKLFDAYVRLQQTLGMRRRIPAGLVPHMGSQWWCLTRRTLTAILNDPKRPIYDRYFQRVWIPDESYFQTLARLHSTRIESRSLTLSKFDYQGKPHIFYDDHAALLKRSAYFVARKIWPQADALYTQFPREKADDLDSGRVPDPSAVDRVFANALERRTLGRTGLYMQSRYPTTDRNTEATARPYSILQGFSDLFADFEPWLTKHTDATVHGHLFDPARAMFQDHSAIYQGGLSDQAILRDYNPEMFLTNLIWNGRGSCQTFQFGPNDNQAINWMVAKDRNARISVISGGWVVALYRARKDYSDIRKEAARLQHIENEQLKVLRSPYAKARVRIVALAEFVRAPMELLQVVVDEMRENPGPRLTEVPKMHDLKGLGSFLQDLRNSGMHPFMTGEFPMNEDVFDRGTGATKPYLVR